MASRRSQRGGSRMGTLLLLVGCAAILGVTFLVGLYTGRHWPLIVGGPGAPTARATERSEPRAPGGSRLDPGPKLTFYEELTAPLTAPPPPPPRPALKPARPPEGETPPAPPGARFTVQVGAYKARPPAEALRESLAAAGHDAHVVEFDAPAGVRYRVRVGSFDSREAARAAATRLASERSLSPFVTSR